jgi:hypothetical protein
VGAAEYAAEVFQLQMSALLKHHGADKVEQSDSCVSRMSLSPNNSLKRASSLLHQVCCCGHMWYCCDWIGNGHLFVTVVDLSWVVLLVIADVMKNDFFLSYLLIHLAGVVRSR